MSESVLMNPPTTTPSGEKIHQQWRMPGVKLGDVVIWYEEGVIGPERGRAAFVSKVNGRNSVALNIIDPGSHNFILREGVRAAGDPRAKPEELVTDGLWTLPE